METDKPTTEENHQIAKTILQYADVLTYSPVEKRGKLLNYILQQTACLNGNSSRIHVQGNIRDVIVDMYFPVISYKVLFRNPTGLLTTHNGIHNFLIVGKQIAHNMLVPTDIFFRYCVNKFLVIDMYARTAIFTTTQIVKYMVLHNLYPILCDPAELDGEDYITVGKSRVLKCPYLFRPVVRGHEKT